MYYLIITPPLILFKKLPSGAGMVVLASNCVRFQYTRAVIDTISHSTQALPPPVTSRMVDKGRAAIAGVCQHKSNQLFIATMGWLKRSAVRVVQRLATGLAHRLFNTTPHKNGSNKPTVYHGGSEALEIIVAKGSFEGLELCRLWMGLANDVWWFRQSIHSIPQSRFHLKSKYFGSFHCKI